MMFDKTEEGKFVKTWRTSWKEGDMIWQLERLEVEGNTVNEHWVRLKAPSADHQVKCRLQKDMGKKAPKNAPKQKKAPKDKKAPKKAPKDKKAPDMGARKLKNGNKSSTRKKPAVEKKTKGK